MKGVVRKGSKPIARAKRPGHVQAFVDKIRKARRINICRILNGSGQGQIVYNERLLCTCMAQCTSNHVLATSAYFQRAESDKPTTRAHTELEESPRVYINNSTDTKRTVLILNVLGGAMMSPALTCAPGCLRCDRGAFWRHIP